MRPLNQLRPEDYDIVVLVEEEEPQAQAACGSFADGKGGGTPRPSWIQLKAPVQEQKASIPVGNCATTAAAPGA